MNSAQSQRKLPLPSTPRQRICSESTGAEINVKTGLVLDGLENDDSQVKNQRIRHIWKMLTWHHYSHQQKTNSASTTPAETEAASSLPLEMESYMPKNSSSSSGANTPTDYFSRKRHFRQRSTDVIQSSTASSSQTTAATSDSASRKRLIRRKKKFGIEGKFHQDVMGVTFLEVCHARDLPPERNCNVLIVIDIAFGIVSNMYISDYSGPYKLQYGSFCGSFVRHIHISHQCCATQPKSSVERKVVFPRSPS